MANDVTNAMKGRPELSNMDDDETVTVHIDWFNHSRRDYEWFRIGAVFGVPRKRGGITLKKMLSH